MKKIKNTLWVIIALAIPGYIIFKIVENKNRRDRLNENKNIKIRAVIINERNYMGNSPVSHEFAYSYLFLVDGKSYKGNSKDSKLKIGDSIEIEYVNGEPNLNRPALQH